MNVQCPQCGRQFEAPDEVAGRKARCGACKRVFIVQAPAEADEYDLEQPLAAYVRAAKPPDCSPPLRPPAPSDLEEEEPLSLPARAVVFVSEYLPGLFSVKVLVLSVLCALAGFAIMGLCIVIFLLGGAISAFGIGAFGLICYAQALGMLLSGEVALLPEALAELNGTRWMLFLFMLLVPFFLAFIAVGEKLAAGGGG